MSIPPPPQPPSGKAVTEAFIDHVESLRGLAKKDPKKFDGVCDYVASEISRFGKMHDDFYRDPQPDKAQELLTMHRRLSSIWMLLSYLKVSK